ncbi:hypothetical protein WG904_19255 [Pedobacter sp. Du54]|uniref:hypothetical protein n=1 Tax=Pedobacter anseongensis TaxID=3133439 RepID=UPI0030AF9016
MFDPYQACPCQSGKKAKFCCLSGGLWNKKPSILAPLNSITGYSHSKCYAKHTNDCSSKISGEHYISEFILNNLGDANAVNIGGLAWRPQGEITQVAKKAFVANVLCERHNALLSPFDNEMGKFHRTINEYDKGFQIEMPNNEFNIFCGEDLEKWLLKTACTFISSNQIVAGDTKVNCQLLEIYTDILFKDKPFPEGWGMYVDAESNIIQHYNYISFSFTVRGDMLKFMKIIINSLTFYLVLDKPQSIKKGMIYRPRGIEIKKDNIKKIIEICWQDKSYAQGVFLNHQKLVSRSPEEWQNIIYKDKSK